MFKTGYLLLDGLLLGHERTTPLKVVISLYVLRYIYIGKSGEVAGKVADLPSHFLNSLRRGIFCVVFLLVEHDGKWGYPFFRHSVFGKHDRQLAV
ncbi:MAG TPA: hypothetical protein DCZ84_03360 [Candidatus Vogelbacteria bacterium]|nr:hypothetical protein [Candidatus Vogelbacteria bacterium]HCQ92003.1 hypothetical protein [Candidatus Vogelbacteria bacterium]